MNKEQIYDEQISPLIRQVAAICLEHNIACFINFAIPTKADATLQCTTMLPDETGNNPPRHLMALQVIGYNPK